MEAGLDSIGAVELRNAVSAKFGVELPATVTFDYPTAADLARFVVQRSSRAAASSGEQPSATFQAGSYITLDKHSENRAIWKATCFDWESHVQDKYLQDERQICWVQGQQQQTGVSHAAVAEQLQAAISELLGFTVPLDQVLSLS